MQSNWEKSSWTRSLVFTKREGNVSTHTLAGLTFIFHEKYWLDEVFYHLDILIEC